MNKKYYRKRELLEKGFTERMIKKLLPPPRVVNRSLSRGRTKLNKWNKSTVEEVMKSTAFHEALEKSRIRKEISKKGALTRRQNDEKRLNNFLDSIRIDNRLSINEIIGILEKNCFVHNNSDDNPYHCFNYERYFNYEENYNCFSFDKENESELYFFTHISILDVEFDYPYSDLILNKCIVNYIYFNLVYYDKDSFNYGYATNKVDWFIKKEATIYSLISNVYPELKKEAEILKNYKIQKIKFDNENRNIYY